jgi:bla regulator protein BlaR1
MFFTHFVVSFILSTFTVVVIMLIRKIFQKQLSAKWQYNIWFLLPIALTLPFIPNDLFGNFFVSEFNVINEQNSSLNKPKGAHILKNNNWMQNFTVSVNRLDTTYLDTTFAVLWILGICIMTILNVHSWLKLKRMQNTTLNIKNKDVLFLFEQCKQSLNITKHLNLRESQLVKTPMTFGLFRTYVVLPKHYEKWLSMNEIKYIFLHELHHYKYKDIATNYLILLFQTFYWFNPFVWIAFREMRLDREIACDIAVLHSLDKHCYAEYGNTIIHFVDRHFQSRYLTLANQLFGSKTQIKRRIERIASFTDEPKRLKWKSIAIFIFVGCIVAFQVPIISVMAYDDNQYEFTSKRAVYEDLSKYFSKYEGSFVLYDMKADQYSIYNENKSTLRVSPNSTYKIYSALFGLESNIITNENTTMKWNGIKYSYDAWNRDQNLSTAMKYSVNWYFQELDKKVRSDITQVYLKQIGYGNYKISGDISPFWLESSLKISPIEQVESLKALYTNEFGFKDKNIKTVKDSIKIEEKNGILLSGKTGTGSVNGKKTNGWFIGYIESQKNTYFFATNIQKEDNSYGTKAAEITLSILKAKGLY